MTAARQILEAIRRFEEQHGEDEQFRDVFTALADAESALEKAAPSEPSPGQQAVKKSVDRAAARAERRPKPEKPPEKEEPPKSLAEARSRAKQRIEDRNAKNAEQDAEPAEAEPAAA